jgi:hypothetical protein
MTKHDEMRQLFSRLDDLDDAQFLDWFLTGQRGEMRQRIEIPNPNPKGQAEQELLT